MKRRRAMYRRLSKAAETSYPSRLMTTECLINQASAGWTTYGTVFGGDHGKSSSAFSGGGHPPRFSRPRRQRFRLARAFISARARRECSGRREGSQTLQPARAQASAFRAEGQGRDLSVYGRRAQSYGDL